MQKSYEFEDSYNLISRKRYKVDCGDCSGHRRSNSSEARPDSPSNSKKEGGLIPPTPQKLLVNPPIVNQTPPRVQGHPSPQQPQPPRRNRMGDDMKLPAFKGTRLEDPEQHWFLCEVVWSVKQVIDDDIKMAQLTTTFKDRALNWFMKYSNGQNRNLVQVKVALIGEFKKSKSESQCITDLKEIK